MHRPENKTLAHIAKKGFLRTIITLLGTVALITGCTKQHVQTSSPKISLPESFQSSTLIQRNNQPDEKPTLLNDRTFPRWWQVYKSPELNSLVEQALIKSHELRISAHRVVQASSVAAQKNGDRYPVVTAPVKAETEAPSSIGSVPKGGDIEVDRTYQAGLKATWTVDLWGEKDAQLRSAEYQMWQAMFDYQQQRRQLVHSVVTAYIDYLALNDRLRGAKETEKITVGLLNALEERLERGDATSLEVERQRNAAYITRTLLPSLKLDRERTKNQIALLTGVMPHHLQLSEAGLNSLHYASETPSVPSQLLTARPDIKAAETQLLSAGANIDAARAQLLPTFNLTAELGYGSARLEELFQPHTLFWRFLADITTTIFDSNRRQLEVELNESLYQELLENYYLTIYRAVQEVETALAAVHYSSQKAVIQETATLAAKQAWQYSDELYALDSLDYFALLDSARTYQTDLQDHYQSQQEKLTELANLYLAIGAGSNSTQNAFLDSSVDSFNEKPGKHSWTQYDQLDNDESWYVVLSGIYTKETTEIYWQNLSKQPELVSGKTLIASTALRSIDQQGNILQWYRLHAGNFSDETSAEQFCANLGSQQLRCNITESIDTGSIDTKNADNHLIHKPWLSPVAYSSSAAPEQLAAAKKEVIE